MNEIIWAILTLPVPVMIVYCVSSYMFNRKSGYIILDGILGVTAIYAAILYAGLGWFTINSEAFDYSVDVVKIEIVEDTND